MRAERAARHGSGRPDGRRLALAVCVPIVLVVLVAAGVVVRDLMIGPRIDAPLLLGGSGEFDCHAGINAILADLPGETQVANSGSDDACHGSSLLVDDGNGTGEWTYRIAVERSEYDGDYAKRHDLDGTARECELLLPGTGATTKFGPDSGPYCVWRNPEFSTDEERSFSEVGLVRFGTEIRVSVVVQSPPKEDTGWLSPAVRLDMLAYLEDRAASVFGKQLDPEHKVADQFEEALGDTDAEAPEQISAIDWCALPGSVGAVLRERRADFLEQTDITDFEAGPAWSERFAEQSDCYRAWKARYTFGAEPNATEERFDVAASVTIEPWAWGESGLAAERSAASKIFQTPDGDPSSSPRVYAIELDNSSFELSFLIDDTHVVRIVCAGPTHFGSESLAEEVGSALWAEVERIAAAAS